MWKDAQSAFAAADYAKSASSLEAIIKLSGVGTTWANKTVVPPAPPNRQWLEPVFFMLGATHFNAKDWPAAIDTFARYQQLFPKSPRLNQVIFSQAQAELLGGRAEDSMPLFTSLLPLPEYHVKALLFLVEANKKAGKPEAAIALMEKEKALPNLSPDFVYKMNVRLLPLYLNAGNTEKATVVLQEMDDDIAHVADVPAFNSMAERLGDLFLTKNDIANGLNCYRRVRDNGQIITLQRQQIESLQRQSKANLARIQTSPLNSESLQQENKDIVAQIAKDQQILIQYQTLPPVLPPLFLRIARAYSLQQSLWEAAAVYREILRRYPQATEAEPALYGSIVLFEQLKRNERAQALCQTYLTQYPKGKYADSVGFIRGALAYDAGDFDQAITYFQDCLKNQPKNPQRERIELIIGDIKLRQTKFDEALTAYQTYEKDYPQGQLLESAEYHSALALLFGGRNDEADKALHAYLTKYPQGANAADAEYRLAVIKFADKKYDEVLADGVTWQKKHGKVGPLAEVLTLMGDCYESQDKHDEAVKAYMQSFKAAQTVEVTNYAIMAAAKIWQKQCKWPEIAQMFQDFVKANPEHPTVIAALSWIGRADIKMGKVEEGKQFLAATARQYLNDPSREAVDEIITQLAQLYARGRRAVPTVPPPAPIATSTPGSTTNAVTATPPSVPSPEPPADPAKDLAHALTVPGLDSQPTAQARILYAKSELARLQKKPEIEKQLFLQIAKTFKPEELSPIILGQVGDCLVQNDQWAQAVPFYNQLMDTYEQSPLVDYAFNGLGRIAYLQKDFVKANKYYSKALDKGLAASKLKEITLGEAQTLMALNRPVDAKPLFEQVAGNRAWRGKATALSVFSLGEIQMALGKFAEANAYYQRVFVAYQKFPDIQAQAYLKSGEAFEKLGKVPEAVNTYTEMVRNPRLAEYPEIADAKKRLAKLPQK